MQSAYTNDNHANCSCVLQNASFLDEHAVATCHNGDASEDLITVLRLNTRIGWLHFHKLRISTSCDQTVVCNALKMSSYVIAHSSLLLQVGSELSRTRFEEEVSEERVGGELHDIGSSVVLVRLRVRQVDHLLHEAQALLRILVRGSLNRIICRENQCPV